MNTDTAKGCQLALKEEQHSFLWPEATDLLFLIRCFRVNLCTIILWDTDEHGYSVFVSQLSLNFSLGFIRGNP